MKTVKGVRVMRTMGIRVLFVLAAGVAAVFGSGESAVSQTFTATGTLTEPRIFHTATLLMDGRVLLAGGSDAGATAELFDPATTAFFPAGSMITTRTLHSATLLNNGQVLLAGGVGNGTSAELFDPVTGVFSPTGGMTTARSNHTATLLPDGDVLLAGGTGSDGLPLFTAERYDSVTGTFTSTGSLTAARTFHRATLLTNGQVLLTGGADDAATTELYDPNTEVFTPASNMTELRSNHTATLLSTGQVLIVGGAGQGGRTLSTAELFDPTINASGRFGVFTPTGSLLTARTSPTATLLSNGQVLIAGGLAGGSTAELFDPLTGVFSATESLTTERAFQTATRLSTGQVLIVGGVGGSTTSEFFEIASLVTPEVEVVALPDVALEMLVNGRFNGTNTMTAARQSHTATLLSTGQVLVTGGVGGSATAELFDTESESFFQTGSMAVARHEHTAVSLPDGRVLIAGGSGGGATAEFYDPTTELFSPAGNMTAARSRHTSTLLADGRVLIAGGISEDGLALTTVEVFDPITETFTATSGMATARSRHTATLLLDGRVLLTGGLGNIFALGTAELFDPTTGFFTEAGGLVVARSFHTSTLLTDGSVLVAGGVAQDAEVGKTAELFNVVTESFVGIGNMTTARELHTATLLPSGHVILAGGVSNSAEAFDPLTASFVPIAEMTASRQLHTTTLLPSGQLLLTGGIGILSTAELFVKSAPDVAMTITKLKLKAKETGNKLRVKVTISNLGTEIASAPFSASLFLSDDETFDEQDALLQTIAVDDIGAGESENVKFKVNGLGAIGGMFAIVSLDSVAGEENIQNNILAQFVEEPASVTVIVAVSHAGAGSGVVSSIPEGIVCPIITCSSNFVADQSVLFTATADPGSVFTGWLGDTCNVSVIAENFLSGTCEFLPVLQNRSLIASFELAPVELVPVEPVAVEPASVEGVILTVTTTGAGTVTSIPGGIACGADCAETFSPGAIVILQATPAAGSAFVGWSGGGCLGTGDCFMDMTQNQTVLAQFLETTAESLP